MIGSNDPLKGFMSVLIGLGIGCIGIDPAAGHPRFTFGNVDLMSGVNFICVMIGVVAVSELMRGAMTIDLAGKLIQEKVCLLYTSRCV